MAKKNKGRVIVKLVSTASSYYRTTYKNPRMEGGPKGDGKLSGLKKYDPIVRKYVEFVEKKIK